MDPKQFDEKFVDPKTGETVIRIKVEPKKLENIEKLIGENAQHANSFMQLSRQLVGITAQQKVVFDSANEAEQGVGKEVVRLREEMGLDSGWIFNIPMKMMEKREPPDEEKILSEGIKA